MDMATLPPQGKRGWEIGTAIINLIVAIHSRERRGVCAENLAAATPVSKRKMNYTPMVDDTKCGILKHEDDNAYRRLQQGFEALRPAFLFNDRVYFLRSL